MTLGNAEESEELEYNSIPPMNIVELEKDSNTIYCSLPDDLSEHQEGKYQEWIHQEIINLKAGFTHSHSNSTIGFMTAELRFFQLLFEEYIQRKKFLKKNAKRMANLWLKCTKH